MQSGRHIGIPKVFFSAVQDEQDAKGIIERCIITVMWIHSLLEKKEFR